MSYKKQVYDITSDIREKVLEVNAEMDKLDKARNDYSYDKYKEMMNALSEKKAAIIRDGSNQVDAAYKQFAKDMHEKFSIKAEEVTDDVKLLSGAFRLNGAALDNLMDKYPDNITMQNAIANYADDHKIMLSHPAKTEAAALENAAILKPYYKSVMYQPTWDDIWMDETYYSNLTSEIEDN